ncbi:MAG: sugar ABC transporter permease [Clostridiales bacterium]|nr:sugar ABC transporter permease [Clostridiales bacterium]
MEKTEKTTPTWKQFNRPWYQKLGLAIWDYIKGVGLLLWSIIKAIPKKVSRFFIAIGLCFKGLWLRFKNGDWRTKTSYLIMGFGNFSRGQVLKGFLLLAIEVLYILFMVFLGGSNLAMFGSLGKVATIKVDGPDGFPVSKYVDNSLTILIFSVMAIMLTIFFVYMWILNTKIAYNTQKRVEEGKPLSTVKQQVNFALNDGYHVTILVLPILGILLITVLPLVCNIIVAFTNFGRVNGVNHYPPGSLFTWTGFSAFADVFGKTYGTVLWSVLGWTLVWAVFATFTNFFFGMFLAMMINKKSIKLKAFWRVCFIVVIAVPDFVTLLMMSKFFGYSDNDSLTGPMNQILIKVFGMKHSIDFLGSKPSNYMLARVMVIVINLWRGMPFTMLATMGILMNIPDELYESSRIDGAGPVRRFVSITFPYIMFVMGPQLITTFTGNINNFNVIFFLTGGGPSRILDGGAMVYSTDLLITWLYRLTVSKSNPEYNYGAVIGIFTFLITAFFALIVFNSSKSVKQEDTFQ